MKKLLFAGLMWGVMLLQSAPLRSVETLGDLVEAGNEGVLFRGYRLFNVEVQGISLDAPLMMSWNSYSQILLNFGYRDDATEIIPTADRITFRAVLETRRDYPNFFGFFAVARFRNPFRYADRIVGASRVTVPAGTQLPLELVIDGTTNTSNLSNLFVAANTVTSVVPEPSTIALLGTGLILLPVIRRWLR